MLRIISYQTWPLRRHANELNEGLSDICNHVTYCFTIFVVPEFYPGTLVLPSCIDTIGLPYWQRQNSIQLFFQQKFLMSAEPS